MRPGAAGGKAGIYHCLPRELSGLLFITFKELQRKEVSVNWMWNSGYGAQHSHLRCRRGVGGDALKNMEFELKGSKKVG